MDDEIRNVKDSVKHVKDTVSILVDDVNAMRKCLITNLVSGTSSNDGK